MFKNDFIKARDDYRIARRRAAVQALLARITGSTEDVNLLSYDDVRSQLQAVEKSTQRLEEIPLDAIVGSVNRYHDFTRKFLPKATIDQSRWARVKAYTMGLTGLPPIDVYRIGKVYFVIDGNHRVSVARQMGNKVIQAYVKEVKTKVDLQPDDTPDDLIIKAEQARFLEITDLDETRPGVDLSTTKAGAYPTLLEHIAVHRYYMGLDQQREIPFTESAADWYDEVFLPTANIIRNRKLLEDFPDRTVVDLYLWAADHRAELEEELGWDIGPEAALNDLVKGHSRSFFGLIRNQFSNLIALFQPDIVEGGPPPGAWRERLAGMTVLEHIFNDLIIAIDDSPNAGNALDMTIDLAEMENSRIHGIHVLSKNGDSASQDHQAIEAGFYRRCQESNLNDYDFQVAVGEIGKVISDLAKFADMVVLPLNHPPDDKPISRLSSGLTGIIRSCIVPVLTVPGPHSEIQTILLAFDGSLKAIEAMFIAAYFGTQLSTKVYTLTSSAGLPRAEEVLNQAKTYLSKFPLEASYTLSEAPITKAAMEIIEREQIDLILVGGYGGSTLRDLVAGSVVDQFLREIKIPVLICR